MKNARFRKTIGLLCAAMMFLSMLSGCAPISSGGSHNKEETKPVGQNDGDTKEQIVWAEHMSARKTEIINQTMNSDSFDERFLDYLSRNEEGNYMASPLSFRYALGLLLAGADGETKAELLSALGVSSEEEWIAYCLDFNGFVEYYAADLEEDVSEYEENVQRGWIPESSEAPFRALRVANSVWKAERIKEEFKEGYKESVEKNYAAEYRSFTAENAVEKINEWADIKTEHMIDKLLPDDYDTSNLAVPNEPKVFNADRPFFFYIYATCNDTTAMMFAGEIVE